MRINLVCTLLFCFLPLLLFSQKKSQKLVPCSVSSPLVFIEHEVRFQESTWVEISSCSDCASCQKKTSSKVERSKKFSFFCDDIFIGSFDLLEIQLVQCNNIQYSIKNSVNFYSNDLQAGSLPMVINSVFDKMFSCYTDPFSFLKSDTIYQDFSFINTWFFLPKEDLLNSVNTKKDWMKEYKADENPVWLECNNLAIPKKKENCTIEKLEKYTFSRLIYPRIARELGTEGTVIITFLIGKDGFVSDIKIVRDIGSECGDAAYTVIEEMLIERLQWIPAKKDNQAVTVRYVMPIQFRLE